MPLQISSIGALYKFAEHLRHSSSGVGALDTASIMVEYFSNFWSTSFESLGALRAALIKARIDVAQHYPPEVSVALDEGIDLIDRTLGNKYRGL